MDCSWGPVDVRREFDVDVRCELLKSYHCDLIVRFKTIYVNFVITDVPRIREERNRRRHTQTKYTNKIHEYETWNGWVVR